MSFARVIVYGPKEHRAGIWLADFRSTLMAPQLLSLEVEYRRRQAAYVSPETHSTEHAVEYLWQTDTGRKLIVTFPAHKRAYAVAKGPTDKRLTPAAFESRDAMHELWKHMTKRDTAFSPAWVHKQFEVRKRQAYSSF